MIYWYICHKCLEKAIGKPVASLSVPEYKSLSEQNAVQIEHDMTDSECKCKECQSVMTKVLGLDQTYVRGYGLADRKGAVNDMNLYKMTENQDPYKQYRTKDEKDDLVDKLRKSKQYNPRARRVFLK